MCGQKLRAMVIHHTGVKTSTSFPPRQQQVMGKKKKIQAELFNIVWPIYPIMPLALLTSAVQWRVFLYPVWERLYYGGVLHLDLSYISRPCLPAALG